MIADGSSDNVGAMYYVHFIPRYIYVLGVLASSQIKFFMQNYIGAIFKQEHTVSTV